ncbi:GTP-binding protein SAS1, putative [Entamoeba invadens IP1]|uniref:GTP-binding protein SAS1, putative n=1 Tax=Entamoeba invadens IP1 TaxID=370355 RepID=A0A0A1U3R9_ENTIV|nr:GTP-binding protein SAS1, putative [Entamoeba invadens IP1]ELP88800.1 GTP-binding protein SAS1, putative [Entamoeba invadens IP1]|eukprot:XP_004255571.1 GTP-binding protein SAS1, putative [Entamoeba invadens IP1]
MSAIKEVCKENEVEDGLVRKNAFGLPVSIEEKLILLGESAVGKTSIIQAQVNKVFNPSILSTVGVEKESWVLAAKEGLFCCELWDTAGQEKFRSVTKTAYRGVNGVIFVFDVSNKKSFDSINFWIDDFKKSEGDTMTFMLCGNKCDIAERIVTKEEAKTFADKIGMKYFETSAKNGTNIKEMFKTLVKEVYEKNPELFGEAPQVKKIQITSQQQISDKQQTQELKQCC